MSTKASVVKTIKGSADEVWKTISDFRDIEKYLPAITNSTVKGSGVGAERICTLEDGSQLVEKLEKLDNQTKTLSFSIADGPMPMEDYYSTIQVRNLGEDRSEVDWSATFKPKGMPENEVREMLEGFYTAAIEGLEKLHG